MPIQVGSLQWLKANAPEKYAERMRIYRSAYRNRYPERNKAQQCRYRESHPEKMRNKAIRDREARKLSGYESQKIWLAARPGYSAARAKNYRLRNPELVKCSREKQYLKHLGNCPLCCGAMKCHPWRSSTVCRECRMLIQILCGKMGGSPPRETITEFIKTITEGDRSQWQNVIAQRKVHKLHKDLLKTLTLLMAGKTEQSSK